jgi:hypothetical protein
MSLLQSSSTEGTSTNEVLLSYDNISKDTVTLISGQNLTAGTVLGVITASGKYTLHNNAASDGSEAAAAVLVANSDASGGDLKVVVINRLAEVKNDLLVWKTGISGANKTAGLAALAAKFIIAR